MIQFAYIVGTIVVQCLTLWLSMLGVLVLWDVVYSKFRSKRYRRRLHPMSENIGAAAVLSGFALAAAALDSYILSPALSSGIQFFFAG